VFDRLLQHLRFAGRDERGLALVLSLATSVVLTLFGTTVMLSATRNEGQAARSRSDMSAHALAEAGLNNAMSILSRPSNDAMSPTTLPGSEAAAGWERYDSSGTAYWWGTFDAATTTWTLHGKGVSRNPAGGREVIRYVQATTKIRGSLMQPANNPVWNYVVSLATGTPGGCDMQLENSMNMQSPLYVMGNLCLNTPSQITAGPLVVKGSVKLDVNTNVGTASAPINEAHVAGGCSYKGSAFHSPCGPSDMFFATKYDSAPPALTKPTVSFDYWYAGANPGPRAACSSTSGSVPVFDNDGVRNASVPGVFNLTPPTSDYSCIVRNWAGEVVGELSWNHTTKVMTVLGTIFIDGSAKIEYGFKNVPIQYNGQGTLYLSGTLLVKNTQFCGGISSGGSGCDYANWDPNHEMLVIVAAGSGGQLPVGDSIQCVSAHFQGGLWAEFNIELDTTCQTEGPMIAGTEVIGQSTLTHAFPLIEEIPVGAPGVPVVYADPDPLTNYTAW
jgi:hypothetical protein